MFAVVVVDVRRITSHHPRFCISSDSCVVRCHELLCYSPFTFAGVSHQPLDRLHLPLVCKVHLSKIVNVDLFEKGYYSVTAHVSMSTTSGHSPCQQRVIESALRPPNVALSAPRRGQPLKDGRYGFSSDCCNVVYAYVISFH